MEKPKSWRFPSDDFPFELGGLFRFQADDFQEKIARKTNSRPSTTPTCLWKKILHIGIFELLQGMFQGVSWNCLGMGQHLASQSTYMFIGRMLKRNHAECTWVGLVTSNSMQFPLYDILGHELTVFLKKPCPKSLVFPQIFVLKRFPVRCLRVHDLYQQGLRRKKQVNEKGS